MNHTKNMVLCVSITLPEKILAKIDTARGDVNRSKYISKLLSASLAGNTTNEGADHLDDSYDLRPVDQ